MIGTSGQQYIAVRLERPKEELNQPTVKEYLKGQWLLMDATEQPSESTRIDGGERYASNWRKISSVDV